MRKNQEGFTLIELMVVIVIIGILVAIALPNFIGATDRAKVANVKSNAHTIQTMLESYGVDFGGKYPDNIAGLQQEAISRRHQPHPGPRRARTHTEPGPDAENQTGHQNEGNEVDQKQRPIRFQEQQERRG